MSAHKKINKYKNNGHTKTPPEEEKTPNLPVPKIFTVVPPIVGNPSPDNWTKKCYAKEETHTTKGVGVHINLRMRGEDNCLQLHVEPGGI